MVAVPGHRSQGAPTVRPHGQAATLRHAGGHPPRMARPLIVSIADLAPRLGWSPPNAEQRRALTDALEDAHDDVEAYLGQPITPTTATETGRFAYANGWELEREPLRIVSATPEKGPGGELTGMFTVTYEWGLDAAGDPELRPIRRYIIAQALQHPSVVTLWQASQGDAARRVRSLSAEGQSVSFDYLTPGGAEVARNANGTATAATSAASGPPLSSLDRWRIAGRRVYQRPGNYYSDLGWRTTGTGYVNGWWEAPQ